MYDNLQMLESFGGIKEIHCHDLATKSCGKGSHVISVMVFLQFRKVVKKEEAFEADNNGSDNQKGLHSKHAQKWLAVSGPGFRPSLQYTRRWQPCPKKTSKRLGSLVLR